MLMIKFFNAKIKKMSQILNSIPRNNVINCQKLVLFQLCVLYKSIFTKATVCVFFFLKYCSFEIKRFPSSSVPKILGRFSTQFGAL